MSIVRVCFPLTLFLSAALLFMIQPMIGKILLPLYGGTPATWTVCMLFFQVLVLAGYLYAWLLSVTIKSYWRWVHFGVCLLSLYFLPLHLNLSFFKEFPEFSILFSLGSISPPLLLLAASAPLLQLGYTQTNKAAGNNQNPYYLYAASSIGSLFGLLSYPIFVEKYAALKTQFYWWNWFFFICLLLSGTCLLLIKKSTVADISVQRKISAKKAVYWILLGFTPCSLMLGVTAFITTDVAATPFFWILPLALYLLSFVPTFASRFRFSNLHLLTLLILILPVFAIGIRNLPIPIWILIVIHVFSFFFWALFCNSELMRTRPNVEKLTGFYFLFALGGALAGVWNGLLAPHLFKQAIEYPLSLLLGLLLLTIGKQSVFVISMCGVSALSLAVFTFNGNLPESKEKISILTQQRNFFGIKQVFSRDGAHVLMSQNTIHGFQIQDNLEKQNGTIAYYGAIASAVRYLEDNHSVVHATIIGLGTGMLKCQFRQQDEVEFMEIDPQMISIAQNPKWFSYLQDCPAITNIRNGDGLLTVKSLQNISQEIIVMDAFNSDAIPIHLLTLEAFTSYQQKLAQDGIILVNMTNRHINILPVLIATARRMDFILLYKHQDLNQSLGQLPSTWALLTLNERLASQLMAKEGWQFISESNGILWTNQYSNILSLLSFFA